MDNEGNSYELVDAGQDFGAAPVDTAPSTTMGANSGAQFPRIVDVDNTSEKLNALNTSPGN